jgi:hypothetical protein
MRVTEMADYLVQRGLVAFRKAVLTFDQHGSIGERSGE